MPRHQWRTRGVGGSGWWFVPNFENIERIPHVMAFLGSQAPSSSTGLKVKGNERKRRTTKRKTLTFSNTPIKNFQLHSYTIVNQPACSFFIYALSSRVLIKTSTWTTLDHTRPLPRRHQITLDLYLDHTRSHQTSTWTTLDHTRPLPGPHQITLDLYLDHTRSHQTTLDIYMDQTRPLPEPHQTSTWTTLDHTRPLHGPHQITLLYLDHIRPLHGQHWTTLDLYMDHTRPQQITLDLYLDHTRPHQITPYLYLDHTRPLHRPN